MPAVGAPSGPGVGDWFAAPVEDGAPEELGEAVGAIAVAETVGAIAVGEAVGAIAVAETVGAAVTIGDAVGLAVGLTVGFGVGVGVEPALTTIVPVICSGWIWQK